MGYFTGHAEYVEMIVSRLPWGGRKSESGTYAQYATLRDLLRAGQF